MKFGDRLKRDGFLKKEEYVAAFNSINREDFLPESMKRYSTSDEPLPINSQQTQTAPHMNAIFVEELQVNKSDVVLEVGTGSGYLTAILATLAKFVITIEFFPDLVVFAGNNLKKYDFKNIYNLRADFYNICWKIKFDKIVITAALPKIPEFIYNILNDRGIAVFPLGKTLPQELVKIKEGKINYLGKVYFVNIIY